MLEMTPLQWAVLVAVLLEVAFFLAARRLVLPCRAYRILGLLALGIGLPVLGWLGYVAGQLAWDLAWRAAAEYALLGYVVGAATWLGWRESRPF